MMGADLVAEEPAAVREKIPASPVSTGTADSGESDRPDRSASFTRRAWEQYVAAKAQLRDAAKQPSHRGVLELEADGDRSDAGDSQRPPTDSREHRMRFVNYTLASLGAPGVGEARLALDSIEDDDEAETLMDTLLYLVRYAHNLDRARADSEAELHAARTSVEEERQARASAEITAQESRRELAAAERRAAVAGKQSAECQAEAVRAREALRHTCATRQQQVSQLEHELRRAERDAVRLRERIQSSLGPAYSARKIGFRVINGAQSPVPDYAAATPRPRRSRSGLSRATPSPAPASAASDSVLQSVVDGLYDRQRELILENQMLKECLCAWFERVNVLAGTPSTPARAASTKQQFQLPFELVRARATHVFERSARAVELAILQREPSSDKLDVSALRAHTATLESEAAQLRHMVREQQELLETTVREKTALQALLDESTAVQPARRRTLIARDAPITVPLARSTPENAVPHGKSISFARDEPADRSNESSKDATSLATTPMPDMYRVDSYRTRREQQRIWRTPLPLKPSLKPAGAAGDASNVASTMSALTTPSPLRAAALADAPAAESPSDDASVASTDLDSLGLDPSELANMLITSDVSDARGESAAAASSGSDSDGSVARTAAAFAHTHIGVLPG